MTIDTSTITNQKRHPTITAAALICFLLGVAWPIGIVPTIVYMIRYRALPIRNLPVLGEIRALSGPFEALGMNVMIVLAVVFTVINLLEIPAGIWLWQSRRKGGVLAASLLALSAVFWFGFALPYPPIVGLLQAGLLATGWNSLKGETP